MFLNINATLIENATGLYKGSSIFFIKYMRNVFGLEI
jgi:hypothetical protein